MGPNLNDFQEKRRLELNKAVSENQRIKLGVSRKNWKKLKRFHVQYNKVLEDTVTQFTTKLVEHNIDMNSEEATIMFNHYEAKYRDTMKFMVFKLGLHSKEGREEILNKFTDFISKMLKKTAEEEKQKKLSGLDSEKVVEIISMALKLGASKDSIVMPAVDNYKDLIVGLKTYVPRGGKTKFEAQATDYVKKLNLT